MFLQNIYSQELPPIQNFTPENYNAESQNWAISQSPEKLIYIANNKGLLEFNSTRWKLYLSPNESIMRSVKVVNERIYTGCFMEFGYWKKNDLGELFYTSLSKNIGIELKEDEEFWNIISIDDYIVFQSLKRIYIYNVKDEAISTIDSNNTITNIFKVNQNVYFQIINEGIFKIEFGKAVLVFDDELVKNNEIINIFPIERELLILTRDNGFYTTKNDLLVKWNITSDQQLSKVSVYDGIRLKDKSFVLGTISHGVIYLNEKGGLLYHIDQNKGLLNSTVLSLFEDLDNNIWLGLDNGISYIKTNAPFMVYNDDKGILGSVYASAINDGNLYLGTNQGLFYKNIESNDDFNFIKGTRGQVWSLKVIDQTLFCGHHSGTFTIEGNKARKIPKTHGTWKIAKLNESSNYLLQGNYDGLYILEKSNNTWQLKNKIKNFNNSSRYFEAFGNEIFVNHEYKGVFKVRVDSTFSKVNNVSIDTLIRGSNSGIIKYNEDLLYSYVKGVFKYDNATHKFTKDSILSKVYEEEEYVSGKLTVDERDNNLWIFTNSNISFITPGGLTNTPKIRSIPLTKELRKGIVGYENILRFGDHNKYLLGAANGYITVDINKLQIKGFQTHIGSVITGSNRKNNEVKNLLNKNLTGDFENDENNLEISYYTPEFNKFLKPHYQFQLLGIYDDWSGWSENSNVLFENLPFGDYTFKVRTKIGDIISNNIASYSFSIAKPWSLSNLMIIIYILAILLFLLLMHHIYQRNYRKQRQKLIDENKRELELAQAQNEKEIIKIKNERLEKDFKSKSKELAASTMSIVRKNELLAEVKNQLLEAVETKEAIMPIVNTIDKSLRNNDDWEFFKEAFNNVDRKFLKKLKKLHPNLSPNDLKLCAYLRLNLSSKEIAPLFNISSRSVEIKRYRLRKKMNLSHEKNLVNYILEL
jgi:DNA-binding CsgD family transcriptional regulator